MASWVMEIPSVVFLDIGEDFLPCAWMLKAIHVQNVYNHPIVDLCLAIGFGLEIHGLIDLGI